MSHSNIQIKKITKKNLQTINHNIKLFKVLEKENIIINNIPINCIPLKNIKVIKLNKKPLTASFHYIYKRNA
jgi:hypothetical protein